jgi:DNA-binding NarL/FixJ family response regulator
MEKLSALQNSACQHKPEITDQYAFAKFGLTYRQRQLITLVARGLTTKEISASLNLSQFTVKNHMYRIMKHMDVRSRYEVVDMVRASGSSQGPSNKLRKAPEWTTNLPSGKT